VKWGPFEKGEIGGTGRVQAVFEKYRHMALMHFVAYAYVGENVSDIVDAHVRALTYLKEVIAAVAESMQLYCPFETLVAVATGSTDLGGGCLSRPSAACSKPRAVRTGEADCRCMGLGKKPNGCLASMNPRC
jgi:hypothetical protein